MSKFGNSDYNGPYNAEIRYDESVSDNCHAQLENKNAYRSFAVGEIIRVKVAAHGDSVEFTDDIKEKHSGWKYASIPVDKREKLDLNPKDIVRFWTKNREKDTAEKVAIKAGSQVYHEMDDGEIICTQFKANKPEQKDSPILTASVDQIGDGWKLCKECDRMETATNATYAELVAVVKHLIGTENESNSFSKAELVDIIEYLSGDSTVDELVKEVEE